MKKDLMLENLNTKEGSASLPSSVREAGSIPNAHVTRIIVDPVQTGTYQVTTLAY